MSSKVAPQKKCDLFKRYTGNPILTPQNWPYPANAVINPGAVRLANETVLLVRVEDMHRVSHLTVARSADGFTNWLIDSEPTLQNDAYNYEEENGLADPRIIYAEEQRQYFVTYVGYSKDGCVICLAITKTFRAYARLGSVLPPGNRDACFFPRRLQGGFCIIYQSNVNGESNIYMSSSPDFKHWGDKRRLVRIRPGYWDCHKVGLACPPIEIKEGWMLFYYGVQYTDKGAIYRVGMVLLDLDQPYRVLRRSDDWILEPSVPYEQVGDIGGVVFPTGVTFDKEENYLNLYYGAANCTVSVATAQFSSVVEYILSCPKVT